MYYFTWFHGKRSSWGLATLATALIPLCCTILFSQPTQAMYPRLVNAHHYLLVQVFRRGMNIPLGLVQTNHPITQGPSEDQPLVQHFTALTPSGASGPSLPITTQQLNHLISPMVALATIQTSLFPGNLPQVQHQVTLDSSTLNNPNGNVYENTLTSFGLPEVLAFQQAGGCSQESPHTLLTRPTFSTFGLIQQLYQMIATGLENISGPFQALPINSPTPVQRTVFTTRPDYAGWPGFHFRGARIRHFAQQHTHLVGLPHMAPHVVRATQNSISGIATINAASPENGIWCSFLQNGPNSILVGSPGNNEIYALVPVPHLPALGWYTDTEESTDDFPPEFGFGFDFDPPPPTSTGF